jgi:hypothetical protein
MHRARTFSENTCFHHDPSAKEIILRSATEPRLGILLVPVAADSLPPGIGTPANDTLGGTQGRGGRTHIEEEDRVTVGIGLARVIVDDVSNLLPLAVDLSCNVPVMSVKGRFGARVC